MGVQEAIYHLRTHYERTFGCNIGVEEGCATHGDGCEQAEVILAAWWEWTRAIKKEPSGGEHHE